MKLRRIVILGTGGLVLAAALLFIPMRAAAIGSVEEGRLPDGDFLAGFDSGLYRIEADGSSASPLWPEGEVRKILRSPTAWYFLTSKGILTSLDLVDFADASKGLPVKTYKLVTQGKKDFVKETQDLKDLELDPSNPDRLLTCTKDEVFLSEDGAKTWRSLGQPIGTTGLKAVSFGPYPGSAETAIWASHPIKGLFARKLAGNTAWIPASGGLALIQGTTSTEEIADLAFSPAAATASPATGGAAPTASFWVSNSFLARIYRWDDKARGFKTAYDAGGDFGSIESLSLLPDGSLRFVSAAGPQRLDPATGRAAPDEGSRRALDAALRAKSDSQLLALSFPENGPDGRKLQTGLSELWLASFVDGKPFRAAAENRQALYLATHFVVNPDSRRKYFALMADRGLDAMVVDMKDDNGRLRFLPQTPLLQKMGRTASPLDVEAFVKEAKAKGIYLVARIVVFKDQVLYAYDGGKYAVWDSSIKRPWQGMKKVKKAVALAPTPPVPGLRFEGAGTAPAPVLAGPIQAPPTAASVPVLPEIQTEGIEEYWVDPYSEDVWAYNVAIANEMIARGFDEVQFDYIRFPTDGDNIDAASFRWRDPGMDKESALASFLRYARESIKAPISIDIYGANGWFRSGVRTGQDVELLAKFVDVICPMYYPSHFEQGFLAQAPAVERPYRIYKLGDLRTDAIARGRIVVRPYVQAFYMNVSYDRVWYNLDYVKREVAGVRDAVNLGMTFWNNGGRYDDIPLLRRDAAGRLAAPAAADGLLD